MDYLHHAVSGPETCQYLKDRSSSTEYYFMHELDKEELSQLIAAGWRRMGFIVFRPVCEACRECQPVRIDVARFRPNRSQRRALQANQDLRLTILPPLVTESQADLALRHHRERHASVGWPEPDIAGVYATLETFSDGPLLAQEWRFSLGDELVGVCWVDPVNDGYSAIYSVYEPSMPGRSLGTFMVLSIIAKAKEESLPHVYLGYLVRDCRSMRYKAAFRPQEIMDWDSLAWQVKEEAADELR